MMRGVFMQRIATRARTFAYLPKTESGTLVSQHGCCYLSTDSNEQPPQVQVEQTKTRRRRRNSASLTQTAAIPSYKEFIHRMTVISLYRNFLKEIRSLPSNQEDFRAQVRREFKANKNVTDPFNLKWSLADGKRRFEELQNFTGNNRMHDKDSWINTHDPEDPRGRVGTGWPWDRSD